jgi:hypothetical protein
MRNVLTTRRALMVIVVWAAAATPQTSAQSTWLTQASDHFDIYYQPQHANQVEPVATEAERAYTRISADLQHDLASRLVVIMLNGADELPGNEDGAMNIIRRSGAPEGGDHLLLAVDPREGREGTITHELTHQFEFEIIPASPQIPSWVYEGLAEYERIRWTSSLPAVPPSSIDVPALSALANADRSWGGTAFAFIGDEFGTNRIRRYLAALRDGGSASQRAFGVDANQFDRAFRRYVTTRRSGSYR